MNDTRSTGGGVVWYITYIISQIIIDHTTTTGYYILRTPTAVHRVCIGYMAYGIIRRVSDIYMYVRMYVQVVSVSQTDSFFCLILLLLFLLACDIFCDLRHPDAKPGTSYVNLYYLFKSQPRARPCLQQQSQ